MTRCAVLVVLVAAHTASAQLSLPGQNPKLSVARVGTVARPATPLTARDGAIALRLPVLYKSTLNGVGATPPMHGIVRRSPVSSVGPVPRPVGSVGPVPRPVGSAGPVPLSGVSAGWVPLSGAPVYEPRIEIDRFGLTWSEEQNAFVGSVRVYVVDTLRPTESPKPLPSSITMQLRADGATVDPELTVINESDSIAHVAVSTVHADPTVRLHIVPLGLTTPVDVDINVTPSPLAIAMDDTMPGFGLGRADVTIALPVGAKGDSVDVSLTARHGSVSPSDVWVRPGRPGHAVFRSDGLDAGFLAARAVGTGYADGETQVIYDWPLGFLIATLLGVVSGTVAIMVFQKLEWTTKNLVGVLVGGLVTGPLLAILGSLLGIKIADFAPGAGGGLVAVFVLALVGTWLGAKLFDILVPTRGGGTPAPRSRVGDPG